MLDKIFIIKIKIRRPNKLLSFLTCFTDFFFSNNPKYYFFIKNIGIMANVISTKVIFWSYISL